MLALDWQVRLARRRRTTFAIAASIVLHLAVGYGVARVSWTSAEHAQQPVHVVLINEWPHAIADTDGAEGVPPPEEPLPVNDTETVEPPSASPTPPVAEAPSPAETPQIEEPAHRQRATLVVPNIDWEQERKNAVQQMLEAQARDEGRITFSHEELFEKPAAEPPNPREHIFDAPQRGRSWSALTPGRGRSHFANRVAELCNALTGGALCAGAGPGADFFADIRPAYMDSLPVCIETRDPLLMPERSNAFPTIKCRLVEKDELE